jgi:hypothetical protein
MQKIQLFCISKKESFVSFCMFTYSVQFSKFLEKPCPYKLQKGCYAINGSNQDRKQVSVIYLGLTSAFFYQTTIFRCIPTCTVHLQVRILPHL